MSDAANEKREESARFEVWMDAARPWWRKWSTENRAACSAAQIADMMREAFEAGFNTGSALPEAAPLIGWIAVKDRLPNDDSTVLIAMKDGDETVWLGYYDGDCWYRVDATPIRTRVTHWAPKPSPPMNK